MPQAGILQVTPTILYLAGLPVGEDMEGEIIDGIIDREHLKANPIRKVPTYNEGLESFATRRNIEESTKEKLKGLGYLE